MKKEKTRILPKNKRVIFSEILHNQEFTVMKTRMMNNFDSIKILMRIETENNIANRLCNCWKDVKKQEQIP